MGHSKDLPGHPRLSRVPIEKDIVEKEGAIWNLLISKVYTPYVFLGLDLAYTDHDLDIKRMVKK